MPLVQARNVLRSEVFSVDRLELTDASGAPLVRHVVRHPGAVVVVPETGDGRLVMIRNFRVAVQEWLWEFCAGKLERGEDPALAAGRELEEETGHHAARIARLGEFFTSPGFADERMHAFAASGLSRVPQRLEPGERIEVEILPVAEVETMIHDGRIRDGKTIAAFALWRLRRT
ncbi:MAG: NUDIX hydrolase [Phycisphaerales bacterium]